MTKLKIIVISTCFPRKSHLTHGVFIYQQIKALMDLGVECHVIQPINWFPPFGLHKFHPYWKLGYEQSQDVLHEYNGIKIHHPKMFARFPSRFFKEEHWERMGKFISRYITSHSELKDAQLLYAHFLCHEGYAASFVKDKLQLPLAAIARGDDVHEWPAKHPSLVNHLHRVFEKADLLLANSSHLADDTQHWMLEHHKKKVYTIYNGIDLDKFTPLSSPDQKNLIRNKFELDINKKYLVCVATPVALKGWNELIQAWQLLKDNNKDWCLLAVVPSYTYHDALDLSQMATNAGIESQFKLLTDVPHEVLAQLYKACDAFVLPSYNEGMSNALLEALASGLPVVVTDVGGHSEVVFSGKNGFLISPGSTESLVNGLTELMRLSAKDIALMGEYSRVKANELGTYTQNARLLLDLFNKIVS